jgi:hypothetical protein
MRLIGYACKQPTPPLRHSFVPLSDLLVLIGANDVGKSSLLRVMTRDLNGGHFDQVDEEMAKLVGGIFYAELTLRELDDLLRSTAFERRRLKSEHQIRPDSNRPPYDAGLWQAPILDATVVAGDLANIVLDDLRMTRQERPEDEALFIGLAASTVVGFECAGRDRRGRRVWNAYWCLSPFARLDKTIQGSLLRSDIERFARQRRREAGERWLLRGLAGFYEVSHGRPSHLHHEEAPVAIVSLGSTTEAPLPRALAVPTESAAVREAVTDGVNSLAEVIMFAREDVRLDGDPLSPDERRARLPPGSWLGASENDDYSITVGARAACAFISAAANEALPPFVTERYRLRIRFHRPPDWFSLGPLTLELSSVDDQIDSFSIEKTAEGFRLWVQLAILDALEEAVRVESFLWDLANDWCTAAQDASHLHERGDTEAAAEHEAADLAWRQFEEVVTALLNLDSSVTALPKTLEDFLRYGTEADWTTNKRRVGRLFAVDEPERHLQPRLQRRAAQWLAGTSQARRAPLLMATHSPPFLSLPAAIAQYVLVDRLDKSTTLTPFEPSDLSQLDEVAQALTFDRGELLSTVGVWLIVEGPTDVVVLRRLFAKELHQAGIGVIPMRGTARWQGILEADALWRYTRVPIAVMFDNVPAARVEELLVATDAELEAMRRSSSKGLSQEVRDMAHLIVVAREHERPIRPVPNSGVDMLSHLDEGILGEITNGKYPGHDAADQEWSRHNKGSRDDFYKLRYGLEKRPETFAQIADLMVDQNKTAPGLLAAVEYCAALANTS